MRLSQSLLRSAILLAAVVVAGCDRDVDSVTAPARVPSGPNALIVTTGYSDVSVGANFACAVRAVDGGVVCWGENDYGKATPPTTGAYRQVSAGLNHACALRSNYFVVCWGQRDWGATEPPSITFSQVSAGYKYSCGVRMDNRALACWGTNGTALANAPASVAFKQVSAGAVHMCGVAFADSRVLCWGSNQDGAITVPLGTYTQVDVGGSYTCAIRTTGERPCWGANYYGQNTPQAGTYTQVAAAYTHTCALRASDRSIVCWGQDRVGMLNAPAGAYTKLSAGDNNACAIRASDLVVVCWGNNSSGMSSPPGLSPARKAPSATMGVTAAVRALDTITVSLFGARVDGFPAAKTFTYQFDCGDGKGYGAVSPTTFAKCPTRVAGNRAVRAKVIDQDGDTAAYSMTVSVALRPQTVTFTSTAPISPVINTTLSSSTYTPSARSMSGLAITFTAASYPTCSLSGNVVTFLGRGNCIIAADQKGDSTWAAARTTQSVNVIWPFSGFFTPVRNAPYVNAVAAGRYVKIPFSVSGNMGGGSSVVPSNTASSYQVTCNPNAPRITVTSFGVATSGVAYDVGTGRYILTWLANAAWAGTCRTLVLTLADGTTHTLQFAFN